MSTVQTTLFKSNKSQAVRLPKAVAMPDSVKRVDIIAVGNARVIVPAGESWDLWFAAQGVSADFMETRDQPADQERAAQHAQVHARHQHRDLHDEKPPRARAGCIQKA